MNVPARLLNKTATVQRLSRTETSTGWREAYVTQASGVKCRLVPISTSDDVDIAAALQGEVTHSIYFLPNADVQRDDRVQIDGTDYDVRLTQEPSIPIYLKAMAVEVQKGR